MAEPPDIVAINLAARLALLETGETVPIVELFNSDGEETDDHTEATAFSCGRDNLWLSASTAAFQRASTQ